MYINTEHVICKNRFDIQVQLLSMLPRTTGTEKQFPSLKGSEQTGFTGTSWGGMLATTQEDGANPWVIEQNVVLQRRTESKTKECANFKFEVKRSVK